MTNKNTVKVVVIEDDVHLLRLYEISFKNAAFPIEFIGFNLANEAIEYMMDVPVDMVIVDMHLPDTNGYKLIDALYTLLFVNGTAIVVVSGKDSSEITEYGVIPKDVQILSKPVPFKALLSKLQLIHRFKFEIETAPR